MSVVVRSRLSALLAAFATLFTTACLTTNSYVDPTLPKVAVTDLKARPTPAPLVLKVNFQTMGKDNLRASGQVFDQTSAILRSSGLFSNVVAAGAENSDQLMINMNNVGDIGKAVGKGIGTGLTLGLAGSMVTDGYDFAATFQRPGAAPVKKEYKHALHTTIGNHSGPPGLTAMSPNQAFEQVVKELVLKLLKDLQDEGVL
jgi:hypothetical protein